MKLVELGRPTAFQAKNSQSIQHRCGLTALVHADLEITLNIGCKKKIRALLKLPYAVLSSEFVFLGSLHYKLIVLNF